MSYKLGLILSMVFVVAFLLLGADMMCLSAAYSQLDSASISIGYLIAKSGRVDEEFLNVIETNYNVTFLDVSPSNPSYGDVVDFIIYRNYHPIIMSSDDIMLKAKRTTVVGYYG